jgi:HEAT repeat protein
MIPRAVLVVALAYGHVLAKPPATLSTPGDFQLSSADSKTRQQSIQLLLSMIKEGSSVPPERLLETLADAKLPPEEGVPAFESLLNHPSTEVRFKALWALSRQYGAAAQSAVPGIIQLLNNPANDDAVNGAAARVLGQIGSASPGVVDALANQLNNPKNNTVFAQTNIIQALAAIGAVASNSTPVLLGKLNATDPTVQCAAFDALYAIIAPSLAGGTRPLPPGRATDLTPQQLIAAFKSIPNGQSLSQNTIACLSQLYTGDTRPYVKCAVVNKIGSAIVDDSRLIKVLLDAEGSSDEHQSERAAEILDRVDNSNLRGSLAEVVNQLAQDGSAERQEHSAKLLKKLGSDATTAVPGLVAALQAGNSSTDLGVILSYLDALRAIGPSAQSAGPVIVRLLSEQNPIYQGRNERAAHHLQAILLATLADIGVPSSALPFILDGLANSDASQGDLFAGAARAAGALGPAAREAIPYLLRPLNPSFRNLFVSLDATSSHQGSAGTFTTPRIEAMRALAKMGTDASVAVGLLTALVDTTPEQPENPERLQQVPDEGTEARLALNRIRGN